MYPCLHRRCLIVFLRPQLSDELCLFQVGIQTRRKQNLIEIRESILAISHLNQINQAQLQTLLTDRNFCLIFFRLFDDNEDGVLEQGVWFGKLKYWYQVSLDVFLVTDLCSISASDSQWRRDSLVHSRAF